ncbi:NAD(P)/FAD-dependent oxidoreductase [Thermoproteota archaeon]
MTEKTPARIVILGAGVAGVRISQRLERRLTPHEAQIILIDENDYHQYLYRIHEVCNLEYRDNDIIVSLSRIINMRRVDFRQASIQHIDTETKTIFTDFENVSYDVCVVALGSHVAYFGIKGLEENSMTLNSFESAKKIKARIHQLFEEAKKTGKPPKILIGGGGFTGVELAGELSDYIPILCKKYGVESSNTGITIVEALSSILPGWSEKQIIRAQNTLRARRIELILNDPIIHVSKDKVEMKSGRIIEPDLLIWTGGVRGDPACGLDFQIKNRRISIDEYCRAEGHNDIFVAGDSACAVNALNNRPMPPTAHIAMVQGDIVMNNIVAMLRETPMKKYIYTRPGEIVTLGKTNAVGDLFGFKFSGFLAKFMKNVVHWWYLYMIGGFKLILENL